MDTGERRSGYRRAQEDKGEHKRGYRRAQERIQKVHRRGLRRTREDKEHTNNTAEIERHPR